MKSTRAGKATARQDHDQDIGMQEASSAFCRRKLRKKAEAAVTKLQEERGLLVWSVKSGFGETVTPPTAPGG